MCDDPIAGHPHAWASQHPDSKVPGLPVDVHGDARTKCHGLRDLADRRRDLTAPGEGGVQPAADDGALHDVLLHHTTQADGSHACEPNAPATVGVHAEPQGETLFPERVIRGVEPRLPEKLVDHATRIHAQRLLRARDVVHAAVVGNGEAHPPRHGRPPPDARAAYRVSFG